MARAGSPRSAMGIREVRRVEGWGVAEAHGTSQGGATLEPSRRLGAALPPRPIRCRYGITMEHDLLHQIRASELRLGLAVGEAPSFGLGLRFTGVSRDERADLKRKHHGER